MNYILMAIPGFFALIFIELLWNHFRGTNYYRLNDAVSSLSLGIMSRITNILYAAVPFSFYVYFYKDFALFEWGNTLTTWIIAFILYDFCYYWVHRMGHAVNIGWASHVIHHSSEEYNLTTALRQTSIPSIFSMTFYIPIALLGFPPWILAAVGSLNLLYQFWVHTQLIDRMPNWFEAIFVTPSNHRVHHAKNKIYVDKNYGGVFIIWDRIFGSFQEELKEEKVIFGINTQLASWNPIWGNLKFISGLFKDAWYTNNWSEKLTLWFRKTGYRPADVAKRFPQIKSNGEVKKFETPISLSGSVYVIIQLVVISAGLLSLMSFAPDMSTLQHYILGITLIYSLFSLGIFQEGHKNIVLIELVKFVGLTVASLWLIPNMPVLTISIGCFGVVSLLFLLRTHNEKALVMNSSSS